MKYNGKPHHWEIENNDSIVLTWDDAYSVKQADLARKNNEPLPYVPYDDLFFTTSRTIRWRGEKLHVCVSHRPTGFGFERTYKYRYHDKLYVTQFVQYKMWGSSVKDAPEITTATHKLKIRHSHNSLTFYETDIRVNPLSKPANTGEPVFEILPMEPGITFDKEQPVHPEPVVAKEKEMVKEEVKLFEINTEKSNSNSLAYYDGENLVVDYWVLGDYSELEQFLTLDPKQQELLRYCLEVKGNNRMEVLQKIKTEFSGKGAFDHFHSYLQEQQIGFNYSVRRD